MKNLFIQCPKCTTCRKAMKFLIDNDIEFQDRNIAEENPTKEELAKWIEKSGLETKKFFNTSGMVYRELGLKDKLKTITNEEMIELLATNGMLVKRPILVTDKKVLVGFKEEQYSNLI